MIINPYRISKDSVPAPDEETLRILINQTYEEICSLRCALRDNKDRIDCKYLSDFLRDSIITNSEILLSISRLSDAFLNSVFILMRTFLEIKIDFLWIYSIFLNDNDNGERLAKRFYQFGATYFLEMSEKFKRIFKNDPFVARAHGQIDIEKDTRKAGELDLIQAFDEGADKRLQNLQKMDWHALPGLITDSKQLRFAQRSRIAAELASEVFNLKDAPYHHNWKVLNAFAHWSSLHYKYVPEDVSKALYQRNMNVSLGFLHDMINVILRFINQQPTERLRIIRNQFIYFST